MKNILIVCTANKIRSVLAMHIANKIAAEKQKQYHFESAGIAVIGSEIDSEVKNILAEMNIFNEHIPTSVNSYDLIKFDEIHVMTKRHKIAILSYYKDLNLEEKIFVLGIDDPAGSGKQAYIDCKNRLFEFYNANIR